MTTSAKTEAHGGTCQPRLTDAAARDLEERICEMQVMLYRAGSIFEAFALEDFDPNFMVNVSEMCARAMKQVANDDGDAAVRAAMSLRARHHRGGKEDRT